jgi:hypothetical protein
LLLFSKSKKELPLVAFFCQEKMQQSCKRLSTAIGAISVVRFQVSGFRFQVSGFRYQVSGFQILRAMSSSCKITNPKNDKIQLNSYYSKK